MGMKIFEVLKIFLKNETFVKEMKRLKIVAKWHFKWRFIRTQMQVLMVLYPARVCLLHY